MVSAAVCRGFPTAFGSLRGKLQFLNPASWNWPGKGGLSSGKPSSFPSRRTTTILLGNGRVYCRPPQRIEDAILSSARTYISVLLFCFLTPSSLFLAVPRQLQPRGRFLDKISKSISQPLHSLPRWHAICIDQRIGKQTDPAIQLPGSRERKGHRERKTTEQSTLQSFPCPSASTLSHANRLNSTHTTHKEIDIAPKNPPLTPFTPRKQLNNKRR